jgi:GT2 family glycosyltransferase
MHQTHAALDERVRVIIPSFRSGENLRAAVEAALNSDLELPLEVVVVDNGENPGLGILLRGLPITIIHDEWRHSAAYARSRGAADLHSGILVFLDDDVICEPQTIRLLVEPILAKRSVATVGNYSSNIDGLGFAQAFKQLYIHRIYSRRAGVLENEYWTAVGAIRADTFHRLGGFDLHFAGACGEDMDLGIRLTRSGHLIEAVPLAVAQHLHPFTVRSVLRNDYRKGMIAMYNLSRGELPISKHRHSSHRDMGAVAMALAVILGLCTLIVHIASGIALFCGSLGAWSLFRADVIANFTRNGGMWFGLRATLFMLLLDNVRAYCLLLGSWKYKLRRHNRIQLQPLNVTADSIQ